MGRLKSNYPRDMLEEEVIEPYSTWQWGILIFAAMSSGLLRIWAPAFLVKSRVFFDLQIIVEASSALAIVALPFLFGKGSLLRAVVDRIREQTTISHSVVALSGTTLLAFPSIYAIASQTQQFHPLTYVGGEPLWLFVVYRIVLMTGVILRLLLPLLILTIPSQKERLAMFCIFVSLVSMADITGDFMLVKPYFSLVGTSGSLGFWLFSSIVSNLTFYLLIWMLDRISFPSFRPLIYKFILGAILYGILELQIPRGWLYVWIHLVAVAIAAFYMMICNPDSFKWIRQEDEETLQS